MMPSKRNFNQTGDSHLNNPDYKVANHDDSLPEFVSDCHLEKQPQGWAMAWDGFALAANEQRRAKSDQVRPVRKG
jgi:hypothetical protein